MTAQKRKRDGLTMRIIDLRRQARASLPELRAEISDIIENKIVDEGRIGRTIDLILGLYEMGIGKKEFLRLNEYFKTIDPESAEFYRRSYESMK